MDSSMKAKTNIHNPVLVQRIIIIKREKKRDEEVKLSVIKGLYDNFEAEMQEIAFEQEKLANELNELMKGESNYE